MSHNKFVYTSFIILAFLARQGFSQNESDDGSDSQPSTVAEKLSQHHIALDVDSLTQALQNSDARIRGLAAVQLGGVKAIAAVPAIENALTKEEIASVRVDMALALSWLGDKKGLEVLKGTCTNFRTPSALRTLAASYLLNANDSSCLDAVLGISESDPEPLSRAYALSLLPKFKNVPEDQSRRIYTSALKSLMDSDPALRLGASQTFLSLENAAAIPDLRRAIASEQNEDVRRAMERDLGRLQEQLQKKKP